MDQMQLIKRAMEVRKGGEKAAIATIIRTKGSTPRKTGSRMIVFPCGRIEGTIGGGCGEAEVIEKALEVIQSNTPSQKRVDLTKGLFFEDGGICGGIMDVFIEPI
ncbi:putative sulfurylase small subunit (molybdopterin cytosine dinucleotide biosynthesis) [Cytobacillus firmus]|uniref:Putative sulfurylase small subunit (Molybdopterin cytosine dinucleotide biosynthesis) n=2 Tax=Cytobacillus TaxID=2675230 RepID=A0A366K3J2_CYTFI|nr:MULTISPECIES: XdhC family protein [Cytobacillus]RBP96260.1 putative sulfurylase small subunit (molybdopterin cytosine dinucleotide biosynthesis) [Cytobacillus firmus]TDX46015.1 putative sulfurylase small subunit (molybdopterin cytosine dinucleotide biosynthesis) [Cytobacillus oceanisediminis]